MEIYSPRLAGWVASLGVPSWLTTAASLTPTPAEAPTKIAGDTVFMGTGLAASSCPVDTLSTCTSAVPVVGAFQGMMKLICPGDTDRKSTRLNSSHLGISYAVFCLKKKKNKEEHVATAGDTPCSSVNT